MIDHAELMESGLLTPDDIVRGSAVLRTAEGRNVNARVDVAGRPAYFIKRPADEDASTLDREAIVLAHLRDHGDLTDVTPELLGRLPGGGVVMSAIDGIPLDEFHRKPATLSGALARALGTCWGRIHCVDPPPAFHDETPQRSFYGLLVPHARTYASMSDANLGCVELLQRSGACEEALLALDRGWGEECLIHGDVRLANIVLDEGDPVAVCIVDWEAAEAGDPWWDMGCLVAEYLALWVSSMPYDPSLAAAEIESRASIPLATVQPFLADVLAGYVAARGGPAGVKRNLLLGYAGAALIRIAYSIGQRAPRLMGHQILLLQLGENLLTEPETCVALVFGGS